MDAREHSLVHPDPKKTSALFILFFVRKSCSSAASGGDNITKRPQSSHAADSVVSKVVRQAVVSESGSDNIRVERGVEVRTLVNEIGINVHSFPV